jgi:riboflavin kinase/FMN adenylyltransferase
MVKSKKIYKNFNINPRYKNSIILIGNFDGVHKGHQKLPINIIEFLYLGLILKFLYIFFDFTISILIEHNYKLPRKILQLFRFLFL